MGEQRTQKLTKRALELLKVWYSDGSLNGRPYQQNSMYTHGRGARKSGLAACQKQGLVLSVPDGTLNRHGWRHDITEAGRAALRAALPSPQSTSGGE